MILGRRGLLGAAVAALLGAWKGAKAPRSLRWMLAPGRVIHVDNDGMTLVDGRQRTRVAHDGVVFDQSQVLAVPADFEERLEQICHAGYIPGDEGPAGVRVTASQLEADVLQLAFLDAYDVEDIVEGLQVFLGLTGDLHTGRKLLMPLGVYAQETGQGFVEACREAALIRNKCADGPHLSKRVERVLRCEREIQRLDAEREARDRAEWASLRDQLSRVTGDREQRKKQLAEIYAGVSDSALCNRYRIRHVVTLDPDELACIEREMCNPVRHARVNESLRRQGITRVFDVQYDAPPRPASDEDVALARRIIENLRVRT